MRNFSATICAPVFCPTVLATSLLLAFGGASAQQAQPTPDEIRQELFTPTSEISIGMGHQSNDARRFGTYRGIGENGAYGLLDLNLLKRDDDTGTWMKFRGKDLGLDSREFRLDHERQGDWSYFFQVSEMARKEPLLVNTGVQGISSTSQTVSAAAVKRNVDLQVEHNIYALGVRKYLAGGFDIRLSAKQDDAAGDRIYGERLIGNNNTNFLTEPIDRTTRQWEVIAGYADRKLQLSGGYSGSSYDTKNPDLRVTDGAVSNYIALPPSNHSHQLHLAGGYNLSDTTRTSFKVSRTDSYQNEAFNTTPGVYNFLNATSPRSLNGKVSTTLVFTDLTMRPMERLNLTGNLRYEDRDDQTPEAQYMASSIPSAFSAGISGFNKPRSLKQLKGGLEASYQLDDGYRLIGSLEREDMKRDRLTAPIGIAGPFLNTIPYRAGFREKTDETVQRIEVKRTMSDVLNGGIALIHSKRGGSDYVNTTYTNNQNNVAGLMWADRSRNKVRMTADWAPAEQWSLQLLADFSEDTYSSRPYGPNKGSARLFSGDLNYKINDKWNLTTWLAREKLQANQSTRAGVIDWTADIHDTSSAIGIGVKGKPRSDLKVGADLSGSYDVAEHSQTSVSPTVTSLPGFFYRQASLKLFADYSLERNSGIRVNLNVDRRRNNDWTWQSWTYSDGTIVTNVPYEKSTFLGVSYYYRWR